jgi:hypothetical protein
MRRTVAPFGGGNGKNDDENDEKTMVLTMQRKLCERERAHDLIWQSQKGK